MRSSVGNAPPHPSATPPSKAIPGLFKTQSSLTSRFEATQFRITDTSSLLSDWDDTEPKVFEELRDIDEVTNDAPIEVHVLQSIDRYEYAICFTDKTSDFPDDLDVGAGVKIFLYTTLDKRGPISVLLPEEVNRQDAVWRCQGTVKTIAALDLEQWSGSTYMFTIAGVDFNDYQLWLLGWIRRHRDYSIFEDGATVRSFLEQSLQYLINRCHIALRSIGTIVAPEVCTYVLNYESKERLGSSQHPDVLGWYRERLRENPGCLRAFISSLGRSDYLYYHEHIDSSHRYWILQKPRIEPIYAKLKLQQPPNELPSTIPSATARPSSYSSTPRKKTKTSYAGKSAPPKTPKGPAASSGIAAPAPNHPSPAVSVRLDPNYGVAAPVDPNYGAATPVTATDCANDCGVATPVTDEDITNAFGLSSAGIVVVIFLVAILLIMIILVIIYVASSNSKRPVYAVQPTAPTLAVPPSASPTTVVVT